MGKAYHNPDLSNVLERAWSAGSAALHTIIAVMHVKPSQATATIHKRTTQRDLAAGVAKIIVTAGSLPEAEGALELARTDGVHLTCLSCYCSVVTQHQLNFLFQPLCCDSVGDLK